jgi:predicted ATPase/DNA-binding NarL/FixJ family response regulator
MEAPLTPPIMCPVLIGRVHDLTTLRLFVDRAQGGQGQVALLSGEAGIGKSRLVAEVKTYAASHDFLLVQGSCFPTDHAIPYAPLLDLLRSCLTSRALALPAPEVELVAQAFLPMLPDIGHVLPGGTSLPTLTPLDPEQEKRRRFESLAHFFTAQAVKQPVFLVVEDLHWSDDTSLEFLHYLARRCSAYPLLLLLTYRSDEVRTSLRHFLAQLDRERLTQEILLDRLARDEVEAMLRAIFALLRSQRLELPDLLYALTEGNPFFIEEILTSLIATGEIFYVNGRWERKPFSELHIPRSVQDAVQQRTDQLSQDARRVLILAAVAGRRFDFALLQALTKHDEDQLLTLIKELMAAQLVVEESEEQFAFRHALTRQAIYAVLLVRERKALHRTVAETMERLYRSTLDVHLADLAYHFYEAGAWKKVLEYGQRAGEKAQALYAPQAAIEHFTRALDAAHHLALASPPNMYRVRGQAFETLGDFERARSDYEQALERARTAHDREAEWQSLIDLGFLWEGHDYDLGGTYYQQALDLARTIGDPSTLAHSLNRVGNWHTNVGQPFEALRNHQEALSMFRRLNDRRGIAETLDLLAVNTFLSGDLIQSTTYCEQAITLFRELDNRQLLVSNLVLRMLCSSTNYQTDTLVPAATSFAESLYLGELALKIVREVGQRSGEAHTLIDMAMCLGAQGEYRRALELAQSGLQIAEEIEHREWMTVAHWALGALSLDLLALPMARQHFEQALALAHAIGSLTWVHRPIVTGCLASTCILQHELARAESVLNTALGPDTPLHTIGQRIAWCARAELALAQSDPGLALHIVDKLIASAANVSGEGSIPRLAELRAEALIMLNQGAKAEALLQAAQEIATAQGTRPMVWRISVNLGKLYRAQQRPEEAELAFSTSRGIIEEIAANILDESLREHFLSCAIAQIPPTHPLSPRRVAKKAFGGLTEREREVAALIARGKSNREIADVLVVGYRTIEAHVSNILSKLGFTSRAQIAVWAVERGLTKNVE